MNFTSTEFITFASFAQSREWVTKTDQPFSFKVRNNGFTSSPNLQKKETSLMAK